ncbi:MAG: S1C family serine protease [Gemmatimonadaceae bacterium]
MQITPRWLSALFVVSAIAQSGAVGQAAETQPGSVASVVRASLPSIVAIQTFDQYNRALKFGSGFITSDHRVVTNAHVVRGAAAVEVYLPNVAGYSEGAVIERVSFADVIDQRFDIAVLQRIEGAENVGLSLAPQEPEPGDHVVVIGAPEGLSNTTTDGIVSAVRSVNGRDMLQITAPISPGSSGSPVLNMSGEVVGVATSHLTTGDGLNFAGTVSELRIALAAQSGRIPFPPADDRPHR